MQLWRKNLYAVWFTQFLSLMGFGFGLPFLPFFIQELGITDPSTLKSWTGWMSSGPALAVAIMAPVWGLLADKIGKKAMLIRAMIGGTIVLTGMGLAQSAWSVMIFRILQGLLTGTVTSSAALVASGTPDKNMSYALGFVSSSTFIGWSLGPAVGGIVADHFGYRISFFVGAAMVFTGLFLVLLLIKEPTPIMTGETEIKSSESVKPGKLISPALILLFLLFFFIRFSRVMPTPFLPLFIQELRGTADGSARATGLLSGGIALAAAISGLTLSRLGDKMNRLRLLSILIGLGVLTAALIPIIPGFSVVAISLLLTYFFIGGVEPLLMSLTSEQVNAKNRGSLFGIQTAVGSLAWFGSPLLASRVSIQWSTSTVFLCFAICLAITWLVSIIVSQRFKRLTQHIQG